jgi:hypothetical protein
VLEGGCVGEHLIEEFVEVFCDAAAGGEIPVGGAELP